MSISNTEILYDAKLRTRLFYFARITERHNPHSLRMTSIELLNPRQLFENTFFYNQMNYIHGKREEMRLICMRIRQKAFIEIPRKILLAMKKSAKTPGCGMKLASTRKASRQPNVHLLAHSVSDLHRRSDTAGLWRRDSPTNLTRFIDRKRFSTVSSRT